VIDTIQPMLLTEAKQPFDRAGMGWEVKYDGWRVLAQAGKLGVQLRTRNGVDCTAWFPEVAATLLRLKGKGWVFDGEVCILDDMGRSDFNALDARAKKRRYDPAAPVVYCVFDCIVAAGKSIALKPLTERKKQLERLRKLDGFLVVDHIEEGTTLFREAVLPLNLEGMVGKRLDSHYQPGQRSADWVKVKRTGAVSAQRFKREPL
jgi:bifunctional non-homologous end joining protein LigD